MKNVESNIKTVKNHGTADFDEVLDEIKEQIDRISCEMNIYKFSHDENISTYNKLTTILLELKEIK